MTSLQKAETQFVAAAIAWLSWLYDWAPKTRAEFRNALMEGLAYRSPARGFRAAVRAQGTNLSGLFMGILVAAIIGVAVVIPVILDIVNNSSASGNTLTILQLLPLFVALLLLVALAGPVMRRV